MASSDSMAWLGEAARAAHELIARRFDEAQAALAQWGTAADVDPAPDADTGPEAESTTTADGPAVSQDAADSVPAHAGTETS